MEKQAESRKAVVANTVMHIGVSNHMRAQSWYKLINSYSNFTLETPPALTQKESPWKSKTPSYQFRASARRNSDLSAGHDDDSFMTNSDDSLASFNSAWDPERAKTEMDSEVLRRRVAIVLAHQQVQKPQARTLGCYEDSGMNTKNG